MDCYPDPEDEYDIDPDDYEMMMTQDEPGEVPINLLPNKTIINQTPSQSEPFTQPSQHNNTAKSVEEEIINNVPAQTFDEDIFGFEEIDAARNAQATKKRTLIESCFGDIDDIIMEEQCRKKARKDEQTISDLALIERIVKLRKIFQESSTVVPTRTGNASVGINPYRNRELANVAVYVPRWPFLSIKKTTGERLYVRFHSETYMEEEITSVGTQHDFQGFIGNSYRDTWNEAQRILETITSHIPESAPLTVANVQTLNMDPNEPATISAIEDNHQLWVDIYKPRKYIELLSDESTNRTLLHWLRLWDKIVFNRTHKPKPKPKPVVDPKAWTPKFQKKEVVFKLDADGYPENKIALLCGPPGLGKTTLAHMVARHAGYNVVELNASDDRTVEAFKNALDNATQMKSVIDRENRPNCLVLDEIDGAPVAAIEFLIKYVHGTHAPKAKKTKNKTPQVLKRPVICICNDLYVPSLRNLRPIAFTVNFPPTASARLSERLFQIAKYQHVKTDLGALLALCEKTQNDIRACLSVLHFYKSQEKPVRLADIHNSNIGQKDMQKNLFTVWKEIFQVPKAKSSAVDLNARTHCLKDRMKQILDTVHFFGDYDRLIQGVFENYPEMKFRDSQMEMVCEGLEWFAMTDLLTRRIYGEQNFILLPYMQFPFVMWHFLFASFSWPKITFPTAGYEATKRRDHLKSLLHDVINGMQPGVRVFAQGLNMLLDTLPYLQTIINPAMKTVNKTLLSAAEKGNLAGVVDVMIAYNLTYVQQRNEDGTFVYRLDPNIYEIAQYGAEPVKVVRDIGYAAKQLIAREIDLEKMRRIEMNLTKPGVLDRAAKKEVKKPVAKQPDKATPPNHLLKLVPKTLDKKKDLVCRDFFGRITAAPSTAAIHDDQLLTKSDIWYHYKEGYNNAVRKNVNIAFFQ